MYSEETKNLWGWELPEKDASPELREKRAAASSLRALLERFVESDGSVEAYREITEASEALRARLEREPSSKSRDVFTSGEFVTRHLELKDRSVMVGRSNPLAPYIEIRQEGEKTLGKLKLDSRYSGAPGLCHGGVVAAVLDEMLGHAAIIQGYGVVTQSLTVRYLRPTILDRETHAEAHIRAVEGDRVVCVGDLFVDGKRTASAQGVFVDVGGARFEEIFKKAHR